MSPNKPVIAVFLETLLWLPVTFFIWYKSATVLTLPVALLLEQCLTSCLSTWVIAVKQHGYLLEITTTLQLPISTVAGQTAWFAFDLNPLLYSYGLPFFAALTLAAPQPVLAKIWQILLVAALILVPVQLFGLVMTTLKVLVFQTTPAVTAQLAASAWSQSLIGLGYQFGNLVLPSLLPLLAWLLFNQSYVKRLSGHL